ncbi:MAG: WcaI family glycosyltransferase [Weeksellaceae bacterium]|jgi:colanic acid biosynthesis glycosyl transferase WcaI|nr:WcaI family glycosyltransferase [Weeksellaceae bacterium]
MKITIISLNFFPEDTAIGLYSTQMADFLSEKNQVEIITALPYYPQWRIHTPYRKKKLFLKEDHRKMRIYRSRQYVPAKPSFIKRILLMITFTLGAFINLFRLKNKPDLVIAVIPFTSSAFMGLLCKWFFKSKTWIHIQDFEFDAAIESGIIKKYKFFQLLILKFEKYLLNKSDIVSTISQSMMKKLHSKSKTETYFLPNWIDENFITKDTISERHPYLDDNQFNILYSGNIGAKQDWKFFVKVVNAFGNEPEVMFHVVGDGAKRAELERDCEKFDNVCFHPPVNYNELPLLLSGADLHILFQKNDVLDTVMPSKLLGMLASGKMSVVTGNPDSEIRSIFEDNNLGYYIYSGNVDEVATVILKIKNKPSDFEVQTKSAQSFVIENFSKTKVLSKFSDKIETFFS